MIIFDLAALANDEHRRHFIDSSSLGTEEQYKEWLRPFLEKKECPRWKPDYRAYNEACGGDVAVQEMESVYEMTAYSPFSRDSEIWSSRCESTREKTLDWIISNFYWDSANRDYLNSLLKMRPFDDMRPQEELFSYWMTEYYASLYPKLEKDAVEGTEYHRKEKIEFVFSSHKPTIDMFRNRGVFVFDCGQGI